MRQSKQETKGWLQRMWGRLTGNKKLQGKGAANEQGGKLKEFAKDAEHKVEDLIDAAKDKLDRK